MTQRRTQDGTRARLDDRAPLADSAVLETVLLRAPAALEATQRLGADVGATEVELGEAVRARPTDRLGEEHVVRAQAPIPMVGSAVLEDEVGVPGQEDDAGDRPPVDLEQRRPAELRPEGTPEVPEEAARLDRQP